MLKITLERNTRLTTLRVEGRLTGPWVDELERAWRPLPADTHLAIDLSDVTFIGEEGKALLGTMYADGVKIRATGCATKHLLAEIEQRFGRHPRPIEITPK